MVKSCSKAVGLLFGLTTILSGTVFAAAPDLNSIFGAGASLQAELTDSGEMDYLLNPIFCADGRSGEISLIFSRDFRFSEVAYLISNGHATKAVTSELNLRIEGRPGAEGLQAMNVQYGSRTLVCVQSTLVLESVPGGHR